MRQGLGLATKGEHAGMFGEALPDLAVMGERGLDIFHRLELPDARRIRYRCLGTLRAGEDGAFQPEVFEAESMADPARLARAAQAHAAAGEDRPLSLDDARSYPAMAGRADPMALFLRLDFLRAWALADLGLDRFEAALRAGPARVFDRPGQLPAQVALAYDFNRITRGIALAELLLPALPPPGGGDDGTGFALRMLGDLALRGDAPALALACFEAALAIGENPHRRARALAAARACGDSAAIARLSPAEPVT